VLPDQFAADQAHIQLVMIASHAVPNSQIRLLRLQTMHCLIHKSTAKLQ